MQHTFALALVLVSFFVDLWVVVVVVRQRGGLLDRVSGDRKRPLIRVFLSFRVSSCDSVYSKLVAIRRLTIKWHRRAPWMANSIEWTVS